MADGKEARSIGELFSKLANDTTNLVRQEIRLAKVELGQKAAEAGKHVGLVAVGGGVAYTGFMAIVAALILLLGEHIALWLAALIIGIATLALGILLARQQLGQLKQLDPTPKATVETLREDKEWAKEQMR